MHDAGMAAIHPITLPAPDQPGPLRGIATLELHSIQAARLVRGRARSASRPAIIGLIGFAGMLRPVWISAATQDPYAFWQLIQVESELDQVRLTLDGIDSTLTKACAAWSGFKLGPTLSEQPSVFRLQFHIPYAYEAARLLAQFDRLATELLAAGRAGIIDNKEQRHLLDQGGRALRRSFASPIGFKPSSSRVETVKPTAQIASSGPPGGIPQAVLDGSLRPRYLPSAG